VVKKLSKLSHIMETRESWESNQDAILEASLLDNAIISLIVGDFFFADPIAKKNEIFDPL
jgi:hypothetical protein